MTAAAPRLTIKGLAVLPHDGRAPRARRAGVLFEQAATPLDGVGRQRFLDLDTLLVEPLDIAARAGQGPAQGQGPAMLWPLARRQATMLALGIAKRRQRLRASHEGFAGALSEQIAERLRQLAKSLPQIPAQPSPLTVNNVADAARPAQAPAVQPRRAAR